MLKASILEQVEVDHSYRPSRYTCSILCSQIQSCQHVSSGGGGGGENWLRGVRSCANF